MSADYQKWRDQSEYFESLSEVHLLSYQDAIQNSLTIMQLQGCVVEMLSELAKVNDKTTDRWKASESRLLFMSKNLQLLALVDDENKRLKFALQKSVDRAW
jgi:hypothetical protein